MVSLQSKPTVLRPILQTGGKTRLCIVCFIKLSILVIDSTVIPVFDESLSDHVGILSDNVEIETEEI